MRYGLEVQVHHDVAPAVLERARHVGLTEDIEYHAKHCDCVPYERDRNHFHATEDNGGLDAELVSRVLDSESASDSALVASMDAALRSINDDGTIDGEGIEVLTHVHVEVARQDVVLTAVAAVEMRQDALADQVREWCGFDRRLGVVGTAHAPMRVFQNEDEGTTYWLCHPSFSEPPTFNASLPMFEWVRYTLLGTLEFRWWCSLSRDPHLEDIVAKSLTLVRLAEEWCDTSNTTEQP